MIEIYALTDPRDNATRYIGKAKDSAKRLRAHIRERRRDTPVYRWIKKLAAMGLTPGLTILARCEDWQVQERAAIARERQINPRLLNVADGGDEPQHPTDPKSRRMWLLKKRLSQGLREGWVNEATKAKMRARPDVFGGMVGL